MTENNKTKNQELSTSTVEKFLNVQEKDLKLREKELELSAQSMSNSHEYALKALDTDSNDRGNERAHESLMVREHMSLVKWIVSCFILMFIVAIWVGKDQVVLDIIKYFAIFAGGFFSGGYVLKPKDKKNTNDDNE